MEQGQSVIERPDPHHRVVVIGNGRVGGLPPAVEIDPAQAALGAAEQEVDPPQGRGIGIARPVRAAIVEGVALRQAHRGSGRRPGLLQGRQQLAQCPVRGDQPCRGGGRVQAIGPVIVMGQPFELALLRTGKRGGPALDAARGGRPRDRDAGGRGNDGIPVPAPQGLEGGGVPGRSGEIADVAVQVGFIADLDPRQGGAQRLGDVFHLLRRQHGGGCIGGGTGQVDPVEAPPAAGLEEPGQGVHVRGRDLAGDPAPSPRRPDLPLHRIAAEAQEARPQPPEQADEIGIGGGEQALGHGRLLVGQAGEAPSDDADGGGTHRHAGLDHR